MATSKQPSASGADVDTKSALSQIHEHPPLIHIGKVKAKTAKRLKKGKGKGTNEVHMAIHQLQAGLEGDHQPVIISYEEKPRKGGKKKKKINIMGLKIDRKKLKKRMKKNGIRHNFL